MITFGTEFPLSTADFIAEHLTRIIPFDNQSLIADHRVRFYLSSAKPFSDSLGEAASIDPFFTSDKSGRQVMRPQPEIAEALDDSHLTEFGKRLKRAIAGKTFIDLACGIPSMSRIPRVLADNFGAGKYIGVDVSESVGKIVKDEKDLNIPVTYIQSDILAFLSRLDNIHGVVFYIAGLEPLHSFEAATAFRTKGDISRAESAEITHAYIQKCLQEIQRLTNTGDSVIIGPATYGFPVQDYGFNMIEQVEGEDNAGNKYNKATLYEKI